MAVVLREGVNLAEVELGEVVVAYIEHLEERDELDLEAATEFLVLIAALLELKSRLLLPQEEADEEELQPKEAAELLARGLLEYRRYRDAGSHLGPVRRQAPLPLPSGAAAARAAPGLARGRPAVVLGPPRSSHRSCCARRRRRHLAHPADRLARAPARRPARSAPGRGELDFDRQFGDDDRLTQAVTIFALLELHKRGEATWEQDGLFGPIRISSRFSVLSSQDGEEVA